MDNVVQDFDGDVYVTTGWLTLEEAKKVLEEDGYMERNELDEEFVDVEKVWCHQGLVRDEEGTVQSGWTIKFEQPIKEKYYRKITHMITKREREVEAQLSLNRAEPI